MSRLLALAFLAATACASTPKSACQAFQKEWDDCATEAGVATTFDDSVYCIGYEGFSGPAATAYVELVNCYTASLRTGDCSDDEAFAATVGTFADCD